MPSNEQKLQTELNGMQKLDKTTDPLDPANCPTCRSGVVEWPVAIMTDVVNVEL